MELYLLTTILLVLMDPGIIKIEARFDICSRTVITKDSSSDDTCHKQSAILSHEDLSKTCGLPHPEQALGTRIVNGHEAIPGQFPYSVKISFTFCGNHQCDGSIIDSKFILTAAHCITLKETTLPMSIHSLIIEVGAHFYNSSRRNSDCRIKHNVKKFHIHPQYWSLAKRNDIGIIELEEPIDFEYYHGGYGSRGPICLPKSDVDLIKVGHKLSVAGWGRSSVLGHKPDMLNYDTYQVLNRSNCSRSYDNEICMEGITVYKSTNFGDSGSALFATNDNQSYIQVGINSRFNSCQKVRLETNGKSISICSNSIFTRVDSHMEWIESILYRKSIQQ